MSLKRSTKADILYNLNICTRYLILVVRKKKDMVSEDLSTFTCTENSSLKY